MSHTKQFRPHWIPTDLITRNNQRVLVLRDRAALKFTDAFFDDTIQEATRTTQIKFAKISRKFNLKSAAQPAAFIFHLTRCGSSLVSKILAQDPANLVLSEPKPLRKALRRLQTHPTSGKRELLQVVDAFLAGVLKNEKRVIFKFAYELNWFNFLRQLYPESRAIFIYRDPREIIRSNISSPPVWLSKISAQKRKTHLVRILDQMTTEAIAQRPNFATTINYAEFDKNLPAKLMRALDFEMPNKNIQEKMQETMRWHSKTKNFRWKKPARETWSDELAASRMVKNYRRLEYFRKKI